VIEHVLVERGDEVREGQLVAKLSASVERASVSVAQARSQTEAELRQAMASHELARRKLARAKDLLKREFVSDQAVEQAEAEAHVAEQRVAQAREAQLVAQRELRLSAEQLGQRDVRSPFSGIVIERYRTEGERIEREPLVRVAKINPLRVEAIVSASQFGSIAAGQVATVKTDLPTYGSLTAKVVLVDKVIDPASNSFRVRLQLPNPDHKIPSGLRCKVDFASAPMVPSQPVIQPAGNQITGKAALPVTVTPTSGAQLIKGRAKVMSGVVPVLPADASARLVNLPAAPAREQVKRHMASNELRLGMSRTLASEHLSQIMGERTWLSMR
jgi:RND family efflux transporter MFP subunit